MWRGSWRSSFLLSLVKCRQYEQYIPLVKEHDQFRYYRSLRENEATQTMSREEGELKSRTLRSTDAAVVSATRGVQGPSRSE